MSECLHNRVKLFVCSHGLCDTLTQSEYDDAKLSNLGMDASISLIRRC